MSQATEIADEIARRMEIFVDNVEPGLIAAGAVLEGEMRRRAGLDDHTLEELAALGHPYRQEVSKLTYPKAGGFRYAGTTRYGGTGGTFFGVNAKGWFSGIRKATRQVREGTLGHDIKLVHIQSGDLQGAIFNVRERTDTALLVRVGVDPSQLPDPRIIEYIIKGTSKMIGRDFIGMAAVAAKSQILSIMRSFINAAVRAAGAAPA